jgi:hypothetical protein
LVAACGLDLAIDEPPDLDDVRSDYGSPKGTLSAVDDLATLAVRVEEAALELATTSSFAVGLEALAGATAPFRDLDLEEGGAATVLEPLDRNDLRATVNIFYACSGDDSSTEPQGEIQLRAAADGKGLFPVFWGEAEGCRQQILGKTVQFDGAVALLVDNGRSRISPRDIERSPVIVQYLGRVRAPSFDQEDVRIDARLTRTSSISHLGVENPLVLSSDIVETRISTSRGPVIVGISETTIGEVLPPVLRYTIRGQGEAYVCTSRRETGTGECTNALTMESVTW